MARRSAKNLPSYRNSEWQADALTAEILMPYNPIKQGMSVKEIQRRYGVSASAARCRRNKIDKEMTYYEFLGI